MPRVSLQDQLQQYIQSLPQWRSGRVDGITEIGHGWESVIHAFAIDTDELVLRRYAGHAGAEKAEREFHGMQLLRAAGYPVPEVLVVEPDPEPLGSPFILMRHVEGEGLWSQIFRSDGVREDLFQMFVELLVRLHTLDWRPFGDLPLGDPVRIELAGWRKVISEHPIAGFGPAVAWLEDAADRVPAVEPAVIHWDYHPDNILYSERGGPWILDWTQIGVSDPRFDVAWSLLLVGTVEGTGWHSRLLDSYERIRGTELPALEFFEVAAAIKRLYSVAVSLVSGPEALGMRAGATGAIEAHLEAMTPIYARFRRTTGLRIPGWENLSRPS